MIVETTAVGPRTHVLATDLAALDAICDRDVNVVVVSRPPVMAGEPRWPSELARTWEGATEAFDAATFVSGLEDASLRRVVADDLTLLVPRFARLAKRNHVRVRLESIESDACRKLHADQIGLRLVVTYAGPGTEWVASEDVDRAQLGRVDIDVEENNLAIIRRRPVVRRTRAFDVVLMKGDAYPGSEGRGAVHRSPPIEGTGTRRLVLKIDVPQCGC